MMKFRLFCTLGFLMSAVICGQAQQPSSTLTDEELFDLQAALEGDSNLVQLLDYFGADPVKLYRNYKMALHRSDSIWQHDQHTLTQFEDFGVTEHLEILPLIDWFTDHESLVGEAGVAYLIRTDQATILFDLGENSQNENPSSLLKNMEKLGITIDEIDFIVISHNHGDHTGGRKWSQQQTFSLTDHQLELEDMKVYTPEPMTYPGLKPIHVPESVKICEGVGTTGVIPAPLFFLEVGEQALLVNLKDKGIVIISGCGHQTMEKLVKRTELLFDEPIYGVLGGFHLPISTGRKISL